MRIDSHQHFWQFDPVMHSWIDDTMHLIQQDFLPSQLEPLLNRNNFDGCVAIQTNQSEAENAFLLNLADKHDFIKGVIGWVDLQSPQINRLLDYYSQFQKLKGFRHLLQGEKNRALMLEPSFINGISILNKYAFTYDILIHHDQLLYAVELVKALPQQKFVIDHIAKPDIKGRKIADWANDIKIIAQYDNVYCKISGLVTEADWQNWKIDDFTPYLDVVFNAFGIKRLMFGSDWPVSNIAGGYDKMLLIVKSYTSKLSIGQQADFWGQNAVNFYSL